MANCLCAPGKVILVYVSRVANATRVINTKKTLKWPQTVRHESSYILLFVTRYNESTNDDRNDELYTSTPGITRLFYVLLMMSQSSADDATRASRVTTIVTRANLYSHKSMKGTHLYYTVKIAADDGLATQNARASTAVWMTWFSMNIPTSRLEWSYWDT